MKIFKYLGIGLLGGIYSYHHPMKSWVDVLLFVAYIAGITFYVKASIEEE